MNKELPPHRIFPPEDFASYDGFDSFLTHCIHTSGLEKSVIAKAMKIPQSRVSECLNQVGTVKRRFTPEEIQIYIDISGDPRPSQYLKWRQEQASFPKEVTVRNMLVHINNGIKILDAEVKKLNALLETE